MIWDGLKWMFLIIGTTIGAGYASGREIWEFFGHESRLAIFLFSILFSICCYTILNVSYTYKTSNYSEVLSKLMGPWLAKSYDVIIIFYLFTTTGIMISGGGAALEYFQVPFFIGIFFMCLLLMFIAVRGVHGLTGLNSLLMPILIVSLGSTLLFYFWTNLDIVLYTSWTAQRNWPAAITFTSLNLLPLVAVLSAAGKEMKSKTEIFVASIGSAFILGGMSFLYNESLVISAEDIMLYEIPLFAIMQDYPHIITAFMAILLWTAIFTTAASGLFGLSSRLQSVTSLPLWLLSLLLLCSMLPMTSFGFSRLISVLYPLYGFLNLYLLIVVLLHPLFINKKH